MLKNAYLDAKIGVDPAENEPPKECCVVAGISRSRVAPLILADCWMSTAGVSSITAVMLPSGT